MAISAGVGRYVNTAFRPWKGRYSHWIRGSFASRYSRNASYVFTSSPSSSALPAVSLSSPRVPVPVCLLGSRLPLNSRMKTQHGTTANGFISLSAASMMSSVAWSGCMPTTREHCCRRDIASVCFSSDSALGLCGRGVLLLLLLLVELLLQMILPALLMLLPQFSLLVPLSGPTSSHLKSSRTCFTLSSNPASAKNRLCARLNLRALGSIRVQGISFRFCNSKDMSPRPPATSSTPEPEQRY